MREWDDGLFRMEPCLGRLTVRLSAYDIPEEDVRSLEHRWQATLNDLLAA